MPGCYWLFLWQPQESFTVDPLAGKEWKWEGGRERKRASKNEKAKINTHTHMENRQRVGKLENRQRVGS